jgi:hypothetical protein
MMATQIWSSTRKRSSTGSGETSGTEAPGNAEIPKETLKDQDKLGLFRLDDRDATAKRMEWMSQSMTNSLDANRTGAKYDVDIIAIHGLGGTAFKTWTHDSGRMWLRDFAPSQFPGARIFTFGYDSGIDFSRGTGTVSDFAKNFLEAIKLERQTPEVHPLPRLPV